MTMNQHPGARALPSTLPPAAAARQREAVYLPTLFDRLCDDAPSEDSEAPDAYTASRARLREIVLRHLALLLNTTDHSEVVSEQDHPLAGIRQYIGLFRYILNDSAKDRGAAQALSPPALDQL